MKSPRRPGGGRKPGRNTTPIAVSSGAALLEPPGDLSPSQAAFWRQLARAAVDQGTLTDDTTPGFRELCEVMALKADLMARIERFGIEGKAGAERLRAYKGLSARADQTLARFKLTAFGKPAGAKPKAPTANRFASVVDGHASGSLGPSSERQLDTVATFPGSLVQTSAQKAR